MLHDALPRQGTIPPPGLVGARDRLTAFPRLIPYVWPHRRKFYLSMVFSVLVAGLWGLSLSSAYPVATVLFSPSIEDYVNDEIASTKAVIEKKEKAEDERQVEIKHFDGKRVPQLKERISIMRRQSTEQSMLSSASYKLMILSWMKERVVPRLPHDKFNLLALIFAVQMLVTLAKGGCEFVQETLIAQIVELSLMGVRKDCFRRVLRLDYQIGHAQRDTQADVPFHQRYERDGVGPQADGGQGDPRAAQGDRLHSAGFLHLLAVDALSLLIAPLVAIIFARIGTSLSGPATGRWTA